MKIFIFLIKLALCFSWLSHAYATLIRIYPGGGTYEQFPVIIDQERFTLHYVNARYSDLSSLIQLKEVERWYIQRLIRSGLIQPVRDQKMIQELLTSESARQPGSIMTWLTNQMGQPLATVGFSSPPLGELTQMQKRFRKAGIEIDFPATPGKGRALLPYVPNGPRWDNLVFTFLELPRIIGKVVELKKVALEIGVSKKYLRILFLLSEKIGASYHSEPVEIARYNGIHPVFDMVYPTLYIGETDIPGVANTMVDKWGFKLESIMNNPHFNKPDGTPSQTHVLSITRLGWVNNLIQYNRDEYRVLADSEVWYDRNEFEYRLQVKDLVVAQSRNRFRTIVNECANLFR